MALLSIYTYLQFELLQYKTSQVSKTCEVLTWSNS